MFNFISRFQRNVFIFFRAERYDEYKSNIEHALNNGYRVISLEEWFFTDKAKSIKTLILRHDVDHDPVSALRISKIEYILGVRATYYFRWSTLDKEIVQKIINNGGEVGLHYETISRYAIENHLVSEDEITEEVGARLDPHAEDKQHETQALCLGFHVEAPDTQHDPHN